MHPTHWLNARPPGAPVAVRRADAPPRAAVARRPLYTRRRGLHTPVERFASLTSSEASSSIRYEDEHGYAVFKMQAVGPPRRETSETLTLHTRTSSRIQDFIRSTVQNQRPGTCCRSTSTASCSCTVLGRARPCGACASCEEYVEVFAAAWEDEDLICDFGGIVAFRPATVRTGGGRRSGGITWT